MKTLGMEISKSNMDIMVNSKAFYLILKNFRKWNNTKTHDLSLQTHPQVGRQTAPGYFAGRKIERYFLLKIQTAMWLYGIIDRRGKEINQVVLVSVFSNKTI